MAGCFDVPYVAAAYSELLEVARGCQLCNEFAANGSSRHGQQGAMDYVDNCVQVLPTGQVRKHFH